MRIKHPCAVEPTLLHSLYIILFEEILRAAGLVVLPRSRETESDTRRFETWKKRGKERKKRHKALSGCASRFGGKRKNPWTRSICTHYIYIHAHCHRPQRKSTSKPTCTVTKLDPGITLVCSFLRCGMSQVRFQLASGSTSNPANTCAPGSVASKSHPAALGAGERRGETPERVASATRAGLWARHRIDMWTYCRRAKATWNQCDYLQANCAQR